jgi:hypothetical protein
MLHRPGTGRCGVGPGTASIVELPTRRWRLDEFVAEVRKVGRKLLVFSLGFTAVGYLVIEAIPMNWVTGYSGATPCWQSRRRRSSGSLPT